MRDSRSGKPDRTETASPRNPKRPGNYRGVWVVGNPLVGRGAAGLVLHLHLLAAGGAPRSRHFQVVEAVGQSAHVEHYLLSFSWSLA